MKMIWSLGESSSKPLGLLLRLLSLVKFVREKARGRATCGLRTFVFISGSRPHLVQISPKTTNQNPFFCGSGASSSASAPLPAPCEPPPDKASCCVDCAQELSGVNASPLATYCSKCFFFHVSLNNRGLKQPISGATHCILCSEQITQDSKSPVAGCCFMCWESQETIVAAMQAEAKDRNMTAECDVATAERPCVD